MGHKTETSSTPANCDIIYPVVCSLLHKGYSIAQNTLHATKMLSTLPVTHFMASLDKWGVVWGPETIIDCVATAHYMRSQWRQCTNIPQPRQPPPPPTHTSIAHQKAPIPGLTQCPTPLHSSPQ
jgi:hypothetical protein